MEILNVKNLSFRYPLNERDCIKNVSFSLEKGDFAVLCGPTGSGKTTLLRLLKRALAPKGCFSGEILFNNKNASDDDFPENKIGYVMQNPEQQIVTDKVWHELAFALENMNVKKEEIQLRISETAQFFGVDSFFYDNTDILSGGQKQLLNLASVAVMQPELLILDEPTAQLDPVAATEFISVLKRLNKETGVTILIAEHRLDELLDEADKLIVLENGCVTVSDTTVNAIEIIRDNASVKTLMPAPVRLYSRLKTEITCPLNVNEGRALVRSYKNDVRRIEVPEYEHSEKKALEFKDVFFKYSKNSPDVLDGLSLTVYENEIFCILGANGSGKTTALNCGAGLLRQYSGKIKVFDKKISEYRNNSLYINCISMVPQDIGTVFLRNTVREELEDVDLTADELFFDLTAFLDKHPYDLSGGEQQLVATAKALANNPRLLILDEPTKGLDNSSKLHFADVLKKLKQRGVTVLAVTHDVEFASIVADRCAFLFKGRNVSCCEPHEFFSGNSFYTTAASRMTKGHYDNCISVDEAVKLITLNGGETL